MCDGCMLGTGGEWQCRKCRQPPDDRDEGVHHTRHIVSCAPALFSWDTPIESCCRNCSQKRLSRENIHLSRTHLATTSLEAQRQSDTRRGVAAKFEHILNEIRTHTHNTHTIIHQFNVIHRDTLATIFLFHKKSLHDVPLNQIALPLCASLIFAHTYPAPCWWFGMQCDIRDVTHIHPTRLPSPDNVFFSGSGGWKNQVMSLKICDNVLNHDYICYHSLPHLWFTDKEWRKLWPNYRYMFIRRQSLLHTLLLGRIHILVEESLARKKIHACHLARHILAKLPTQFVCEMRAPRQVFAHIFLSLQIVCALFCWNFTSPQPYENILSMWVPSERGVTHMSKVLSGMEYSTFYPGMLCLY